MHFEKLVVVAMTIEFPKCRLAVRKIENVVIVHILLTNFHNDLRVPFSSNNVISKSCLFIMTIFFLLRESTFESIVVLTNRNGSAFLFTNSNAFSIVKLSSISLTNFFNSNIRDQKKKQCYCLSAECLKYC